MHVCSCDMWFIGTLFCWSNSLEVGTCFIWSLGGEFRCNCHLHEKIFKTPHNCIGSSPSLHFTIVVEVGLKCESPIEYLNMRQLWMNSSLKRAWLFNISVSQITFSVKLVCYGPALSI